MGVRELAGSQSWAPCPFPSTLLLVVLNLGQVGKARQGLRGQGHPPPFLEDVDGGPTSMPRASRASNELHHGVELA